MKHFCWMAFGLLSLALRAQAQPPAEPFFLYHLRLAEHYQNPKNWTAETQATIGRHAQFLDSLGQAGALLFAGPTDLGLDDPNLFGIAIVQAASLEAAQKMLAPDPAVRAGIQIAQVLPYRLSIQHFENAPIVKVFPKIKIANDPATIAALKEINRDIWTPFTAAYAAGDAEKYLSLHTPDFIRATVEDVQGFKGALANAQLHFRWNRDNGRRCEIAFTFFERVVGAELASERGIYRYTSIANDGARQDYFGKFHVFHRKVGEIWKIAVDYDSDEEGSIGEADFNAGLLPDVFVAPEK
jgi:uncharacterized protein YciI/ketosteroid isomerase-like protein